MYKVLTLQFVQTLCRIRSLYTYYTHICVKQVFFLCSGVEKCGTSDTHSTLMNHHSIYGLLGNNHLKEYELKKAPGKYNISGNMRLVQYLKDMQLKEVHFYDNFQCVSNFTYDILSRRCPPELIIHSLKCENSNEDNLMDMVFLDSSPRTATTHASWNEEEVHWRDLEPHEFTPDRLHYVTPNAKIIFLIREPASRAYSDYRFHMKRDQSAADFHTKVSSSIKWWKNCTAIYKEKACAYGNAPLGLPHHNSLSCGHRAAETVAPYKKWHCVNCIDRLRLSFYHIYIKEWLRVFPRENLLFLKIEDIYKDKIVMMNKLLEFLGFAKFKSEDSEYILKQGLKNKSQMHEAMLTETQTLLEEFFAPMNKELSNLLQEHYYATN